MRKNAIEWEEGMHPTDKSTMYILESLVRSAKGIMIQLLAKSYDWHDEAIDRLYSDELHEDEIDRLVDRLRAAHNSVTARVDYGPYCVSATFDDGLEYIYVHVMRHVGDDVVTCARKKFPYYTNRG